MNALREHAEGPDSAPDSLCRFSETSGQEKMICWLISGSFSVASSVVFIFASGKIAMDLCKVL
jgi:hypothetical protein